MDFLKSVLALLESGFALHFLGVSGAFNVVLSRDS